MACPPTRSHAHEEIPYSTREQWQAHLEAWPGQWPLAGRLLQDARSGSTRIQLLEEAAFRSAGIGADAAGGRHPSESRFSFILTPFLVIASSYLPFSRLFSSTCILPGHFGR